MADDPLDLIVGDWMNLVPQPSVFYSQNLLCRLASEPVISAMQYVLCSATTALLVYDDVEGSRESLGSA